LRLLGLLFFPEPTVKRAVLHRQLAPNADQKPRFNCTAC
jgi:hypothetical protein